MELKQELLKSGYSFKSNTDTEVACALLDKIYNEKRRKSWIQTEKIPIYKLEKD